MQELRINRNLEVAIEHEEFIANLTRKALKQHCLHWLTRRKKDTEAEVAKLSDRVQHLQRLYEHQDTVLGEVLGSASSELEVELDRMRSYRDTLYSGELLWREASRLTQAGATLARAGFQSWATNNTTLSTGLIGGRDTPCSSSSRKVEMDVKKKVMAANNNAWSSHRVEEHVREQTGLTPR
ncbi:uncharacterized protein LOC120354378 [Nilaparvata lugens]|uniref:uncharacterized protein LOC120354378 n=1 Tax=Nilaparvata lugens TaxID=108931 RepID=UPI00193D0517|nr:uncharacterized protein LOC120354378 [Nilaparvata lugens]